MTDITTRLATLEDIPEMVGLMHKVIREVNAQDYSSTTIDRYIEYVSEEIVQEAMLNKADYYLLESEDIIGVGGIDREKGYIRQMFISSEHQGEGLGRRIIETLEDEARKRGHTTITLYSTLTAVGFYERMGYKQVGLVTFQKEFTTVHMIKTLLSEVEL